MIPPPSPAAASPRRAASLRVALAAFPIQRDPEANFREIESLAGEAARGGARLVVFAEGALSGYYGEQFHSADELDLAKIHRLTRELGAISRRHGLYLAAGTLEARAGAYYNSLLAFSPAGRRAACYRKRHLTSRDHLFYTPGDQPALFRVEGRRFGLLICFDVRFPLWAHEYARRGAEALIYSFHVCDRRGLWKRPVMEAHLRSRAAECDAFALAVNDARPHANAPLLAVDRAGRTLLRAWPARRALRFADLDFRSTHPIEREIRKSHAQSYEFTRRWR